VIKILQNKYTIVKDGKSEYTIVISQEASPSERHAASEIRTYLYEISGCRIPVVRDNQKIDGPMILVGDSRMLRSLGVNINFERLGDEGFVMKTVGPNLILAGGRLRGTLYAVYTFLEEKLGCRWYTSTVSYVPKMKEVVIEDMDEEQLPAFEYREVFFTDAFDRDWAARNKVNGNSHRLDKATGGKISYSHFVHTFYQLVPPEKYFDQHPEYFALVNGKRRIEHAQLCLTNPDVIRIATETVFRWIKEDPDATIFSVSQNDWPGWCECEKCKEIDEKEESHAGSVIHFVNKIADKVAEKYPDKFIDTLAYTYTEKPPKYVKPHKNVIVRLCHMAPCCDSHPLAECEKNAKYVENLKEWVKIANKVYIWHYVVNFAHYLLPFPNLNAIRKDIRFYRDIGVKGIFCQGMYEEGGGGDFCELKAWLLAKLLWNPDADVDALIDDFLKGYYGKAAGPIRRYLDMINAKVMDDWIHMDLYSPPDIGYLTPDIIMQAEKYFDDAERLADNEEILERVKTARISLQYAKLTLPYYTKLIIKDGYVQPEKAEEYQALVKEFTYRVKKNGILHHRERADINEFLESIDILSKKYPVLCVEKIWSPVNTALNQILDWLKRNSGPGGTVNVRDLAAYIQRSGLPARALIRWLFEKKYLVRAGQQLVKFIPRDAA